MQSAYHKVSVDTFHVNALSADFFIERSGERGNERLGTGICTEHRGGDGHAREGAHVQNQATLPR